MVEWCARRNAPFGSFGLAPCPRPSRFTHCHRSVAGSGMMFAGWLSDGNGGVMRNLRFHHSVGTPSLKHRGTQGLPLSAHSQLAFSYVEEQKDQGTDFTT